MCSLSCKCMKLNVLFPSCSSESSLWGRSTVTSAFSCSVPSPDPLGSPWTSGERLSQHESPKRHRSMSNDKAASRQSKHNNGTVVLSLSVEFPALCQNTVCLTILWERYDLFILKRGTFCVTVGQYKWCEHVLFKFYPKRVSQQLRLKTKTSVPAGCTKHHTEMCTFWKKLYVTGPSWRE